MLLAACGSVSVPEAEQRPTPVAPRWNEAQLREHLRFLGGAGLDEQAADARRYALAAAYVAARLAEFRLQPVLHDSFQVRYAPPPQEARTTLGYVAGKHPERAAEAVLVAARLRPAAGAPARGAAPPGVGTAALLELARLYGTAARYGNVPERTLLFAVFSGGGEPLAGLRQYLRYPLWPLDRTRAVVYLGLDPAEEAAVRSLLAEWGLPLFAVPPDSLLNAPAPAVQEPTPGNRRRGEAAATRSSALVAAGVGQALALADSANTLLFRLAVTPHPFRPVAADTLRVPGRDD